MKCKVLELQSRISKERKCQRRQRVRHRGREQRTKVLHRLVILHSTDSTLVKFKASNQAQSLSMGRQQRAWQRLGEQIGTVGQCVDLPETQDSRVHQLADKEVSQSHMLRVLRQSRALTDSQSRLRVRVNHKLNRLTKFKLFAKSNQSQRFRDASAKPIQFSFGRGGSYSTLGLTASSQRERQQSQKSICESPHSHPSQSRQSNPKSLSCRVWCAQE